MRVLLATGYSGAWPYIPELIEELEKLGHDISLLDTDISSPCTLLQKLLYRFPTLRPKIPAWSLRSKLKTLEGNFDAVNIHYVSPIYTHLMSDFRKISHNIISSIWGSELLRANPHDLQMLGETLGQSTLVTTNNPQVKACLLLKYPKIEPLIRIIPFGMRSPDVIQSLQQSESWRKSREKLGVPENRYTIACGYNASQAQQHTKMCRCLAKLPEDTKTRITILLPLTYPDDNAYRNHVINEFREASIDFRVFDKKLDIEDNSRLRISTDCAINIQVSDSLSASIQEHLLCGNALIAGSWLPYEVFEHMGARITRVPSDEEITSAVLNVLQSPNSHYQDDRFKKKLHEFSCWKNSSKRWLSLYRGQYTKLDNPFTSASE